MTTLTELPGQHGSPQGAVGDRCAHTGNLTPALTAVHPRFAAAAHGSGDFDGLHYAVKDAPADILDVVWSYARTRPATWEILAPALAAAPCAEPSQLAAWLTTLMTCPHDPDPVTTTDTCVAISDRLTATDPALLLDVLHQVLSTHPDAPATAAVCEHVTTGHLA